VDAALRQQGGNASARGGGGGALREALARLAAVESGLLGA
jgi:hypothetical protein